MRNRLAVNAHARTERHANGARADERLVRAGFPTSATAFCKASIRLSETACLTSQSSGDVRFAATVSALCTFANNNVCGCRVQGIGDLRALNLRLVGKRLQEFNEPITGDP